LFSNFALFQPTRLHQVEFLVVTLQPLDLLAQELLALLIDQTREEISAAGPFDLILAAATTGDS
jgi:hypothetical protein